MKKSLLILLVPVLFMFTGCFIPRNLTYDSARMMKKGQVEIQGNGDLYLSPRIQGGFGFAAYRFGGKVGFGLSEKYNLKLRADAAVMPLGGTHLLNSIYVELDNKISLKDKIAISIPIGLYFVPSEYDDSDFGISTTPRFYFSIIKNRTFDLTLSPKLNIFAMPFSYHYGDYSESGIHIGFLPGASVGFGFSSNFDKWALRFESGYDWGRMLSAGIGFSYFLGSKK